MADKLTERVLAGIAKAEEELALGDTLIAKLQASGEDTFELEDKAARVRAKVDAMKAAFLRS